MTGVSRPTAGTSASTTKSSPAATTGAILWGPHTMTLTNVPPVVDPWQTADLIATSTRLVTTLRCSSSQHAIVRVTLYNAALTKVSTSPDISCDGQTPTHSVIVTRGATYYVGFYLAGTSVPLTATVLAG